MDRLSIAPPYSQLYLTDAGDERFPPAFNDPPVQARERGIRVSTLMRQDGPTAIDLAVDEPVLAPDGADLAFDGEISTPGHEVVLSDSEHRIYWRHAIPWDRLHVRVWANHPTEPDHLAIELSPARDIQ